MSNIFIKCIFPYNYYLARNVKITKSNGDVYTIGHRQTLCLETNHEDWLDFKLDYHKRRLIMNDFSNADDLFVTVTLKCRKTFPYRYTDVMFKNSMEAKIVSKEDFQNFEHSFNQYSPINKKYNMAEYIAIAMAMLMSLGYVILAVTNENINERNFLFLIGVSGVISSSRLILYRTKISANHYYFVIQTLPVVSLVLLILINFPMRIKVIFTAFSLIQYLITAHSKGRS